MTGACGDREGAASIDFLGHVVRFYLLGSLVSATGKLRHCFVSWA